METEENYIAVLSFLLTGALFLAITFFISKLLRPDNPDQEKLSIYECGEESISTGQVPFNSRFFVISLIFVLFELELIFLFPWAITFSDKNLNVQTEGLWSKIALFEMITFVFIVALGLAYAWAKGHLDWIKPETTPTKIDPSIPLKIYEEVNNRF